jgi:hypothetical protein
MEVSYNKKAEGVVEITTPLGTSAVLKTFTCGHCSGIHFVEPEAAKGTVLLRTHQPPAVCHRCWSLVCPKCHAKGSCAPVEKMLLEIETKDRFLRSAGLLG